LWGCGVSLAAANVSFSYEPGVAVLRDVTLTVPAGAIVGLLGPNGSGKTTLLRLLAGTRQPNAGVVMLDGTPFAQFTRAGLARRMAVVPQETHLAFDYTVGEVAMMGRYAHLRAFEIEGPADIACVDESLAATGTLALESRPFATLSGGEKQRVIIASALAQLGGLEGGILLLDEPTASLDLAYQLDIAALLKRLHTEHGLSIVLSTHDLSMAATLCQEITMLRAGRVIASGAADEALTPANVRAAYDVDVDLLRHPSGQRLVVAVRTCRPDSDPAGSR
jgi:iron complex transport system ATP-binding protein